MASGIRITVGINKRSLRALQRNLGILPRQFARVAQQAANSISLEAKRNVEREIPQHFDEPEALTRESIYANVRRLNSVTDLRDVSAGIGIRAQQSEWLRFHVGDETQVRHPGQIGPANKHIFIPIRKNIESAAALAAGIRVRLTGGQNMPPGTLRRLFDQTGPRNPLFFGRIRPTGTLGLFLRPPRYRGVNEFAPKMLVAAIPRASYRPTFQAPLELAVRRASRRFPEKVRQGARRHIRMSR